MERRGVHSQVATEQQQKPSEGETNAESSPNVQQQSKDLRWYEFEQPLVWRNIFLMFIIHSLCVYGIFKAPEAMWQTWAFFPLCYLANGLGVTAGAHRLWAHRTYKATLPMRILLMIFNCVSFQNDLIEWCRDHRVHHKYSETPADPHNARRGFFFAHIGWLLMRKHPDVKNKGKSVDVSDLLNDPVLKFQRRYYLLLGFLFSAFLPTVIPMYFWGEKFSVAFHLCVAIRYVFSLHVTWLVNSAAHLWGNRPYDKGINPSENYFVVFSAIGEGFHNYHHVFPHDYATSEHGPYLNMTTAFIDLCAGLGLVYDRRTVSSKSIEDRMNRTG